MLEGMRAEARRGEEEFVVFSAVENLSGRRGGGEGQGGGVELGGDAGFCAEMGEIGGEASLKSMAAVASALRASQRPCATRGVGNRCRLSSALRRGGIGGSGDDFWRERSRLSAAASAVRCSRPRLLRPIVL